MAALTRAVARRRSGVAAAVFAIWLAGAVAAVWAATAGRRAEEEFRMIRPRLHVGQPRAQRVRAYLSALSNA